MLEQYLRSLNQEVQICFVFIGHYFILRVKSQPSVGCSLDQNGVIRRVFSDFQCHFFVFVKYISINIESSTIDVDSFDNVHNVATLAIFSANNI